MERTIEQDLLAWKDSPIRMPLLLRGARQVGKSYVIEQFGKRYFKQLVVINFEFQPLYKKCFESLDPTDIVQRLTILSTSLIAPGETLLFLDEIQECPEAILALRYFKEKYPSLHVIGAGSLLEFALNDTAFRMPVGRVQYLYLHPMSFYEFLNATGNETSVDYLKKITHTDTIPDAMHSHFLSLLKNYFLIGGMPAAVNVYREYRNFTLVLQQQQIILNTYQNDFSKYDKKMDSGFLRKIFDSLPGMIGRQIKYSRIDPDSRSNKIKEAIHCLNQANLFHYIYSSTGCGLPLHATINEKKFKLLSLDIGLINRSNRLEPSIFFESDLLMMNRGAIAEQFVGQEIIASKPADDNSPLYYWSRHNKGSDAEVDFLIQVNQTLVPIEVKSGAVGRLKSLHLFQDAHPSSMGVKISQAPLGLNGRILSLPLYLSAELFRITQDYISK